MHGQAQSTIGLLRGYKFAVAAIPQVRGTNDWGRLFKLDDEYAVSTDLPDHAVETWQDAIGGFQAGELDNTSFFLWASVPSAQAEVVDDENQLLAHSVLQLYLGLLIAVPYFSGGRLTLLTGANADGTTRARSLTTYPRSWPTVGSPVPNITRSRLRLAGRIARALREHPQTATEHRMIRSIRVFREATEASDLDVRLHQFVRCAEAFALPWGGKDFVDRLCRLCKGRSKQALRDLYRIRGKIEHMRGPMSTMPKSFSENQKHVRLSLRCVEAEALARFLLRVYLLHPELWDDFRDTAACRSFWKLGPAKLQKRWPTKLGLSAVSKRGFNKIEAAEVINQA